MVGTGLHYPAVWDWEAFANDGIDYDDSDCDAARAACASVLTMPVFATSTEEEMDYVGWAIAKAVEDLG